MTYLAVDDLVKALQYMINFYKTKDHDQHARVAPNTVCPICKGQKALEQAGAK